MAKHMTPKLVLVGGFLGAGKTTLILRAAEILRKRGLRVAVIMNDQDSGLVDTKYAEAMELSAQEVAGGCFCCRFSDLLEAAGRLAAHDPHVIFAEPVGSCIDLSATIMQPLKAFHRDEYRVAPLTVLFDPELAAKVYRNEADANVSYLFRHQLAEADLVCATKLDLHSGPPDIPVPVDLRLSAKTGEGIEDWLKEVLEGGRVVGARLIEVDYRQYADAEAALGWLNLHAEVELGRPLSPASLAGPLLDDLDRALTAAGISIAHLKVFDRAASGFIKASICANGDEPVPDGDLLAEPERRHELAINLRAIADPDELQSIVRRALAGIAGSVDVKHAGAFRPAPPRPEHRFDQTVA
jgi:hypothetical protein